MQWYAGICRHDVSVLQGQKSRVHAWERCSSAMSTSASQARRSCARSPGHKERQQRVRTVPSTRGLIREHQVPRHQRAQAAAAGAGTVQPLHQLRAGMQRGSVLNAFI